MELVFAVSTLLHDQFFLSKSSAGIMNIYLAVIVLLKSRGFKKPIFIFLNNRHGYYKLKVIISREFNLFMKIHNFDDYLKTWWRHQKGHVTLAIILGFFERFYVAPHSCNLSCLGLNWFRVYVKGWFFATQSYLMLKRPGWLELRLVVF